MHTWQHDNGGKGDEDAIEAEICGNYWGFKIWYALSISIFPEHILEKEFFYPRLCYCINTYFQEFLFIVKYVLSNHLKNGNKLFNKNMWRPNVKGLKWRILKLFQAWKIWNKNKSYVRIFHIFYKFYANLFQSEYDSPLSNSQILLMVYRKEIYI